MLDQNKTPFTRQELAVMAAGADDPTRFGFADAEEVREVLRELLGGSHE